MEQTLGFSESEAHAVKTKNCLVHQSVARDIPENHPMTGRQAEGSRCIDNGAASFASGHREMPRTPDRVQLSRR